MGRPALFRHEHFFDCGGRAGLAEIDRDRRAFARCWHNHHVAPAADVAGPRPGHRQRKRGGDGRIDRCSASCESSHANPRRQRMNADDHAVLATDEIGGVDNEFVGEFVELCRGAEPRRRGKPCRQAEK